MVSDDDLHAARVGIVYGCVRGDACITSEQQLSAAINDRFERIDVNAMTFLAADGNVEDHMCIKCLQGLYQQGSGGLTINIKVTPDAYLFLIADSQRKPRNRLFNLRELSRRIFFWIKKRLSIFGAVDPASEESHCDERRQAQGLERCGNLYWRGFNPTGHLTRDAICLSCIGLTGLSRMKSA